MIDLEAKAEITFDDFGKLQFQVGEIIACEEVKKAKKLTLFTGTDRKPGAPDCIRNQGTLFSAEEMVGKRVMVVTNLKPAKLAGVLSRRNDPLRRRRRRKSFPDGT